MRSSDDLVHHRCNWLVEPQLNAGAFQISLVSPLFQDELTRMASMLGLTDTTKEINSWKDWKGIHGLGIARIVSNNHKKYNCFEPVSGEHVYTHISPTWTHVPYAVVTSTASRLPGGGGQRGGGGGVEGVPGVQMQE